MPSDRSPSHLYPPFYEHYKPVLDGLQRYLDVHHAGMSCKMIEGFRSAEYQHELYQKGRTTPGPIVTYKDGYHNKSGHQLGCSGDVGIFKGSEYIEEPAEDINDYYGHLLRANGLAWGGNWSGNFKDKPHGEWPTTDHQAYEKALLWQKQQPWFKG